MTDLLSFWNHSSLSSLPSPASPGCPKFSGAVSSSSLASWLRPSLLGFPEEELCPSWSYLSRYLPGTGDTGGTARWTEAPQPWWYGDESDVLSLPTFTWSSSCQTWLILTQEVTLTHLEGCPQLGVE